MNKIKISDIILNIIIGIFVVVNEPTILQKIILD